MPPAAPPAPQPARNVLTVSRLNRLAHELLHHSFPLIWVEGEISNLARPASGHWYFSLKDESAQVRCAMFRGRNAVLGFTPTNGTQVLVRAQVGLYEARGDFQLLVEHMEPAGDGALRRAFDELKQRLAKEGLFDQSRKRALPPLPRRIGVLSSPHGAVLHDILSVLRRRFPAIPVLIYPIPVQGAAAAPIAAAIERASRRNDCDVLILARGGGSLEDLWAFNDERVARAIAACRIPLVTGIGHETDFTIADFVADLRAPTPSVAAESVTPDAAEWARRFRTLETRLIQSLRTRIAHLHRSVALLRAALVHPRRRMQALAQRADTLELRLRRAIHTMLRHHEHHLRILHMRLLRHSPAARVQLDARRHADLARRLVAAMRHHLQSQGQRLSALARMLDSVSPLETLNRGYAIVRTAPGRRIVRSVRDLEPGQVLETQLADGRAFSTVNSTDTTSLKST